MVNQRESEGVKLNKMDDNCKLPVKMSNGTFTSGTTQINGRTKQNAGELVSCSEFDGL